MLLQPVRYISESEAALARLLLRTRAGTILELLVFDGGGVTRTCVVWRRAGVPVSPLIVAADA